MLSIENEVHLALARGEATAVALDQSAVLDTIDHSMLIDCLSSWFGVGGVVLDWFKFYLSDTSQCIKIGSVLSDAKRVLLWYAPWLYLGPILYSLYTKSQSKVIQNDPGKFPLLCRQHTVVCVSDTQECCSGLDLWLKNCLDYVKKWFLAYKLKT